MAHNVQATTIPPGTRIADYAQGAYFSDSWSVVAAEPGLTALGQFIKAMRATPKWIDRCMQVRNRVVQWVGLKDLGGMAQFSLEKPEADYQVGERLGIFTLLEITPDEVLMGDNDKHLKVVLSVSRAEQPSGEVVVNMTTVVHLHNFLGKLYMLPVAPAHKLIAPAVARAIG